MRKQDSEELKAVADALCYAIIRSKYSSTPLLTDSNIWMLARKQKKQQSIQIIENKVDKLFSLYLLSILNAKITLFRYLYPRESFA